MDTIFYCSSGYFHCDVKIYISIVSSGILILRCRHRSEYVLLSPSLFRLTCRRHWTCTSKDPMKITSRGVCTCLHILRYHQKVTCVQFVHCHREC
ncbi:hypothetical protein LY76DRAFT_121667 [Colletotrichum caudatum]|nr:hypothetical protein LY76DRAFT_121667 [Colletotrichum caudatum]